MSTTPSTPVPYTPPAPRRRSLFWKTLALVLATALIATTAIAIYYQYLLRDTYTDFLRDQLRTYIGLVADRLGTPPIPANADALTSTYPIDVRVQGPGAGWLSGDTSLPFPSTAVILQEGTRTPYDHPDALYFRNVDGHFYAVAQRNSWTYVVRMRSTPEHDAILPATLLLSVVLLLIFIAAYGSMQHFLRPIKELMAGVQNVSSGNFEYEVPISSNDELGELTRAFNVMSQQVKAIIASKRRLLFDVSHELRSPLTRMRVAIGMMPDGKTRTIIERNVAELNTMITELLENERLAVLGGTLVLEQVDIVELARNVVETFTEEEDRLEFDTLTDRLKITVDSQRLIVALRNVVSNALKYSAESDEPVRVSVFPDDDGVRMVVSDNGIGISPEAQEKVFEPFYRTDDSRSRATGGYGLGLALTKSIIEAHGGTIQLKSKPGHGTTITIWIPIVPEPRSVTPTMTAMPR